MRLACHGIYRCFIVRPSQKKRNLLIKERGHILSNFGLLDFTWRIDGTRSVNSYCDNYKRAASRIADSATHFGAKLWAQKRKEKLINNFGSISSVRGTQMGAAAGLLACYTSRHTAGKKDVLV